MGIIKMFFEFLNLVTSSKKAMNILLALLKIILSVTFWSIVAVYYHAGNVSFFIFPIVFCMMIRAFDPRGLTMMDKVEEVVIAFIVSIILTAVPFLGRDLVSKL